MHVAYLNPIDTAQVAEFNSFCQKHQIKYAKPYPKLPFIITLNDRTRDNKDAIGLIKRQPRFDELSDSLEEQLTLIKAKQFIANNTRQLFCNGGCNLTAEVIHQNLHLDCYMVYHKFVDFDETGQCTYSGDLTISKDILADLKREYADMRKRDPLSKHSSQPIGHVYFIDYDKHKQPLLCDASEIKANLNPKDDLIAAVEEQFTKEFTTYNFDPLGIKKLTDEDFNILNYQRPMVYSSHLWNSMFSPAKTEALYRALPIYLRQRPWLKR